MVCLACQLDWIGGHVESWGNTLLGVSVKVSPEIVNLWNTKGGTPSLKVNSTVQQAGAWAEQKVEEREAGMLHKLHSPLKGVGIFFFYRRLFFRL
jgi:hypothetical protein